MRGAAIWRWRRWPEFRPMRKVIDIPAAKTRRARAETASPAPTPHIAIVSDAAATAAVPDELSSLQSLFARASETLDVDKIERVLAMIERTRAAQAERAFNAAMAAAQVEIEPVAREADNQTRGSNYAPLERIVEAITPVLKTHGFGTSFQTRVHEGCMHVVADVVHTGGHLRRYEFTDIPMERGLGAEGEERMSAPQTYGATTTYARRYATALIFNVTTTDAKLKDRDGETKPDPALVSAAQVAAIEGALRAKDMHPKRFCARFKIRSVADLPAARCDEALKAIAAVEDTSQ